MADTYYGVYRGKVLARNDPMNMGRLQVFVPSILSGSTWAEACQPYGATSNLPPVGTTIWVMFEEGDPNYPIWIGCTPNV